MGLDDAKIGEQQGDGTRGHGRSAIGMDGELTGSDVTLTEKVTLPTVPPWTLSCPSAQVIDCVKHTSSFRFTGSESPECPCKQVCVLSYTPAASAGVHRIRNRRGPAYRGLLSRNLPASCPWRKLPCAYDVATMATTFAQLLQNLGSYLDLGKRMATTLPGLVMALALVLLTATLPQWAYRPFACGDVRSLNSMYATKSIELMGMLPEDKDFSRDERRLAKAKESALRRDYFRQLSGADGNAAMADKAKTALGELQKFWKEDSLGIKWAAERAKFSRAPEPKTAEQKAAEQIDRELYDIDRALGENRLAELCNDVKAPEWTELAMQLLTFGLLGFALGVLLDPVNKAIFLQLLPEAGERAPAQHRQEDNKSLLKPLTSPIGKLSAAVGTGAVNLIASAGKATRHKADDLLASHSPQFYVGRGMITDSEYQLLVDRYYRFSELTIGLVLPVILIGVTAYFYNSTAGKSLKGWCWLAASIAAGLFLARVGLRRYAEFRFEVAQLITGRLQQFDDRREIEKLSLQLTGMHHPQRDDSDEDGQ